MTTTAGYDHHLRPLANDRHICGDGRQSRCVGQSRHSSPVAHALAPRPACLPACAELPGMDHLVLKGDRLTKATIYFDVCDLSNQVRHGSDFCRSESHSGVGAVAQSQIPAQSFMHERL
jgi:hypothetical protein